MKVTQIFSPQQDLETSLSLVIGYHLKTAHCHWKTQALSTGSFYFSSLMLSSDLFSCILCPSVLVQHLRTAQSTWQMEWVHLLALYVLSEENTQALGTGESLLYF